jgi:hypothetical protein
MNASIILHICARLSKKSCAGLCALCEFCALRILCGTVRRPDSRQSSPQDSLDRPKPLISSPAHASTLSDATASPNDATARPANAFPRNLLTPGPDSGSVALLLRLRATRLLPGHYKCAVQKQILPCLEWSRPSAGAVTLPFRARLFVVMKSPKIPSKIPAHMWAEDHRIVKVALSPLLAEAIFAWSKFCRCPSSDETALATGLWWLAVAGLKHPNVPASTINAWTRYMEAENIQDKLARRAVVENDAAVGMQRLLQAAL